MAEHSSRSTKIGAGCMFGVSLVFAGLTALALARGAGADALAVLLMGALPAWLGWSLWSSATRALREQELADRARTERAILELAAANHGQVNPTLVTMKVPGLSIRASQELLAKLALDGFCHADSDDHGRPIYVFPLGGANTSEPELSPDEWVARMQTRMTGQDASEASSVSSRIR